MIMNIVAFVGRDLIRLIIPRHTAQRMHIIGSVNSVFRIFERGFTGKYKTIEKTGDREPSVM